MNPSKAIKILQKRIVWLERKALTNKLVDKPYSFYLMELAANDEAIKALQKQTDVVVDRGAITSETDIFEGESLSKALAD